MSNRVTVVSLLAATVSLLTAGDVPVRADGPADNHVDQVRRIPKLGIDVPPEERQALEAGLAALNAKIAALRAVAEPERINPLLPDVLIFQRAVDQALRYQEFFDAKELPVAHRLLELGLERAEQLLAGKPAWTRQTGLVVKGYISKIDHTVQPYGLVIPDDYQFDGTATVRLDLWFHGRGETLSEVNFLNQRLNNRGEFTPPATIVLHPYGRYCNANKLAGEIDTFEALNAAQRFYRIDPRRIAVRGFSMGGAACWQFAVHYPGLWFAANPGAGFSETPEFLKVFQNETLAPTWYEQKLWRMYDCTGYAANLAFLPTIAYSGEIDKQKQAADIMETALQGEGLPLLHIIGPMTGHKIHPDSKVEIEKTLSQWERLGPPHALKSPLPKDGAWETIDQFVTYTLRYNRSRMITIEGLQEHWEPSRVVVQYSAEDAQTPIRIKTANVTHFSVQFPSEFLADKLARFGRPLFVEVDGKKVQSAANGMTFLLRGDTWISTPTAGLESRLQTQQTTGLKKQHGLQGPIDDAFLDRFIFVKPTGSGLSPEIDAWVQAEFEHAVEHWRRQFRGDATVKLDTEITRDDMQSANIVLWGDLRSNETLGVLQAHLPIHWDASGTHLKVGEQAYDAKTHLPLLIFPNPLAPHKYVVLNSSFTYREYDYLNNARQTPKLPDWAIVDVRTLPNARYPGKVVDANFFDEAWRLKPAAAK